MVKNNESQRAVFSIPRRIIKALLGKGFSRFNPNITLSSAKDEMILQIIRN
jgi:hypothetical protein